jgi:signal transduction histidine kinase/ligand-binding sensor domain-containing protein
MDPNMAVAPAIRKLLLVSFAFAGVTAFAEQPRIQTRAENIFHTAWSFEDGVSAVFDVQQDLDGYLWLTTANGVFRFDGATFQSVDIATNNAIHNSDVKSIYVAPSGRLWFITRTAKMILLDAGRVHAYPFDRRCISSELSRGLIEDDSRDLWIRSMAGLFRLNEHSCQQMGVENNYPGGTPTALLKDDQGTIWVKAPTGAVLFLLRGAQRFTVSRFKSAPTTAAAFLHQGPDGGVWLSDGEGLRRINDVTSAATVQHKLPTMKQFQTMGDFGFSSTGELWAVAGDSIKRFDGRSPARQGVFDLKEATGTFSTRDGLTASSLRNITVDREGNVWISTNAGLDRLRTVPLTTVTLPSTLENSFSLAMGDRGSVWTGNGTLPLANVTPDAQITLKVLTHSATAIRRDYKGSLWIASGGPVYLWHQTGKQLIPIHYPDEKTAPVVSVAVDRNDEPWINLRSGLTFHRSRGVWINEGATLAKKSGIIGAMANDALGNVWIAFENRLVKWDGRSYQIYSYPYGTIGLSVTGLAIKDDRVWLVGTGGVLLFSKGMYHQLCFIDPLRPGRVSGVLEASDGDLWINGFSGITHLSASELNQWLSHPDKKLIGEHLDVFDGLPGLSAESYPEPSVVEATDGRIWFSTAKGIAWLDDTSLIHTRNNLQPPVFVTGVAANGMKYSVSSPVLLPKRTQNVEIDYTALSLSVPERVSFRYKLDGIDKDWQDAGTRRQAFYTRLPPAQYTFIVKASNNDGVWSASDARVTFTLPPTFFQTGWFKLACAASLLLVLLAAYRFRVRFLTATIRDRMFERMSERERIARDLHDTFFQGIQGLFLRFNTGTTLLGVSEPARSIFVEALKESDRVMAEGRELVLDLHADDSRPLDFAQEIAEMRTLFTDVPSTEYRVVSVGKLRAIHPFCRVELLRITQEAVFNSFRHAEASLVEAEISYGEEHLKICVRDDGRGIDESVIRNGRLPGHLGLVGMQERANRIGAAYTIWSRRDTGTEVVVEVPSRFAYLMPQRKTTGWASRLFGMQDRRS